MNASQSDSVRQTTLRCPLRYDVFPYYSHQRTTYLHHAGTQMMSTVDVEVEASKNEIRSKGDERETRKDVH